MITKRYSRSTIQVLVQDKVAPESKLRDYDILKDRERGLTYEQLAIKYGMHRTSIIKMCNSYKK